MSYLFNNTVKLNNTDAFGKTRISDPFTLGDYSHIYGESPELITVTAGSGTITHITNQASMRLSVGTGNGDYVIHHSRMYHPYMPGKSQNIMSSFVFGANTSNGGVKRIGYFDDRDGIFFQQDQLGNLHWVQRSFVTGVAIDTPVTQSNWNMDKCDGSGASGFNIDITNTQLIFVDYQWLGVGRLRCGFVHDGDVVFAHQFLHSNNLSTVYWSNPALPVRCEVRNITAGSNTSSMDQICSTVISEGGYDSVGLDFSKPTDLRTITVNGSSLPAIAIRLKNTFNGYPNRTAVRLGQLDVLAENNNIRCEIWRLAGGTVSGTQSIQGGTWVSAGDDSGVEYNISSTGWTSSGGNLISAGYVPASNSQGGKTISPSSENISSVSNAKRTFIAQNHDCTGSNIFAVVVTSLTLDGGSNNFRIAMQWRELR